jgi:hypothetical protein
MLSTPEDLRSKDLSWHLDVNEESGLGPALQLKDVDGNVVLYVVACAPLDEEIDGGISGQIELWVDEEPLDSVALEEVARRFANEPVGSDLESEFMSIIGTINNVLTTPVSRGEFLRRFASGFFAKDNVLEDAIKVARMGFNPSEMAIPQLLFTSLAASVEAHKRHFQEYLEQVPAEMQVEFIRMCEVYLQSMIASEKAGGKAARGSIRGHSAEIARMLSLAQAHKNKPVDENC